MGQPILSFQKMTSSHPIAWGSVVFVIGSGFELLTTQKLLGTQVLSIILSKLNLVPHGALMTFLYHGLTVLVGLVLLAMAVHGIARALKSKGRFAVFLSSLLFVTGVMSLASTFVSLIRHDDPGMAWLTIVTSALSLVLYIGVIREVYKLSWGNALLTGGLPILAVSFWVSV